MELRLSFAVSAIGTLRDRCQLSFFFNDTATTEIYTLSLHDALPISSLTALARHFQPTASGGCFPRKKCVPRSEEHTSELQSPCNLVCRLLLEKKHPFLEQIPRTCSSHVVDFNRWYQIIEVRPRNCNA